MSDAVAEYEKLIVLPGITAASPADGEGQLEQEADAEAIDPAVDSRGYRQMIKSREERKRRLICCLASRQLAGTYLQKAGSSLQAVEYSSRA